MSRLRHSQNHIEEMDCTIFSRKYWAEAARQFSDTRILVFAALIIALRVAVKALPIPSIAGVRITFDCYVNALGSIVYGPVIALAVGAISDTIGCFLFPSGPYFFPFIFVEMSSSFIFALFLWRRRINVVRVLFSKFSVNIFSNIILSSAFLKWMYVFFGDPRAATYNVVNTVRIAKNLVLFPLESILIVVVLGAFIPVLKSLKVVPATQDKLMVEKQHIIMVVLTTIVSVALVAFYILFFKDFIAMYNIKFW